MKTPEDANPDGWHRFFGASANNTAWSITELSAAERNPRELLDAAHAAAWHWQAIGNATQRMRALMLLALAHAHAAHTAGRTAAHAVDELTSTFDLTR